MIYLLQHLKAILAEYDGRMPLGVFLKNYFRQFPILGSRDRRLLGGLAYGWYRVRKGFADDDALWTMAGQWVRLREHWNTPFAQWAVAQAGEGAFNIELLLEPDVALSVGVQRQAWLLHMLHQPDLFIRVRNRPQRVAQLLHDNGIPFTEVRPGCLALHNGAAVNKVLPPETYVVQDASSQAVRDFFHTAPHQLWWDCCAGAGGKSLLLLDHEPTIDLLVTDHRETVLHNLRQRFRQYSIPQPEVVALDVADAATLTQHLGDRRFDAIICDAPCSGSGTWARTPEELFFFDTATIEGFAALQQTIACNVARYLKPGGRLYYITCSVLRAENEEVAEAITQHTGLMLEQAQLINGIPLHADCMFVAVLTLPAP